MSYIQLTYFIILFYIIIILLFINYSENKRLWIMKYMQLT